MKNKFKATYLTFLSLENVKLIIYKNQYALYTDGEAENGDKGEVVDLKYIMFKLNNKWVKIDYELIEKYGLFKKGRIKITYKNIIDFIER